MRRLLEKGAILSLSLLLTSTYSVSTVIPSMVDYYRGYDRSQIEQLISVTSIAIMVIILLNPWISKVIRERVSIAAGLVMLAAGGIAPVFVQSYGAVFAGRLVLGAGIGLVNVYAIDIINSRYDGDERSALLGYRGSSEIVGNTALTLVVGLILGAGMDWNYCFLIYLAAVPVLIFYLLFVPGSGAAKYKEEKKDVSPDRDGIRKIAKDLLINGCYGALFIGINTCTTMRIPSLVLEKGIGTEVQASLITSLMMAAGIAAGIIFGSLSRILRGRLQKVGLLVFGAGMAVMAAAGNLWLMGFGAVVTGLAFNALIVTVFDRIPKKFPPEATTLATTCTLVGCNLGSGFSPYVLKLIDQINGRMYTSFVVCAAAVVVIGILQREEA